VEKKRIVFVGNRVPKALSQEAKTIVDLEGRTLLPGLIDNHACFSAIAFANLGHSLSDIDSSEALEAFLQAHARQRSPVRWILGHGLKPQAMGTNRFPDRKTLDNMLKTKPVLLLRDDGRLGAGNTAFFERFHLEMPDEETLGGYLSGDRLASAIQTVSKRLGAKGRVRSQLQTANECISLGVTSLHTFEEATALYRRQVKSILRTQSAMPLRLTNFIQTNNPLGAAQLAFTRISAIVLPGDSSPRHTDDWLLGMHSSPNLTHHTLPIFHEQETLNRFVFEAHCRNMQVALNAVDTEAIEMALTAFERAFSRSGRVDARHRIEQCLTPTTAQIQRLARLGLGVVLPVNGLRSIAANELRGNAPEKNNRLLPLKEMRDAKLLMGWGSFGPQGQRNPLEACHLACNHPDKSQSLTPYEAFAMCTSQAARLSFEESTKGTLIPGKLADFIILNKDPMTMAPDTLNTLAVEASFLAGQPFVHRSARMSSFLWKVFKGKIRQIIGIR
jgi:predicted amidohydrolase YtcJ